MVPREGRRGRAGLRRPFRTMARVPPLKRLLAIVAALLGTLLYVWVAAVRAVPRVKRRKAERRARRAAID